MDAEVYKITSVNEIGTDVTAYALPATARMFSRMMNEQYGNVSVIGMSIADLPEDVREGLLEPPR